ncbi:peptide deformylase 1A, chloroplastic [Magnolia sinica]|uniref:peptide deformylase 1A, chloroplastic n=1 Tax=Magnolia sinica TaxID=86752 RepID=UPI00265904F7|nr:peptide deformylase 1A, chloroplastic [Magnolia sinica]
MKHIYHGGPHRAMTGPFVSGQVLVGAVPNPRPFLGVLFGKNPISMSLHSSSSSCCDPNAMETIIRFSNRLFPISTVEQCLRNPNNRRFPPTHFMGPGRNHCLISRSRAPEQNRGFRGNLIRRKSPSSSTASSAGWFLGLAEKKPILPEIVKAGDPVLHEPAREVAVDEIGSENIEKIIEDMVAVMRKAPGVGLAAPQIGIPLKIIVLEDTKEYISYARKEATEAQDRHPFDLLVILNPKLKKKGNKTALFFEGCLSVDGFRAVVERHLEVEVTGLGRDGQPIKVHAAGWQARILQHECDHLDGTIYVDKMMPRTFRTVENLDLPLAAGCPKLGVR